MKVLIDENLPLKLKDSFGGGHIVYSAREMDWHGKKNGELLRSMIEAGFEVFVTMDRRLPTQQNLDKFPIAIFILRGVNNKLETLQKLVPGLLGALEKHAGPGAIEISS